LDEGIQIVAAGLMVKRPRAVGQQSADHRHTLHRYRARRDQAAGQLGEQRSRPANPLQAEPDARRTGDGDRQRMRGYRPPPIDSGRRLAITNESAPMPWLAPVMRRGRP
jgi:hypothetical protein